MAALRPGNDDKAWNDPPVFAYTEVQGTPAAAAPKRNLLNKRVPYPQDGIKPPSAPSVTGSAPPPTGPATPPVPSPSKAAHSDEPAEASSKGDQKETVGVNDAPTASPACSPESLKEETLSNLDKAVAQCAPNMEKRKQDDHWSFRMEITRKANAFHISLMVDYVSEVSQWMLGIKHLILAAQAAQEKPAIDTQEST
ncbi:hypothetical protein MRX96_038740 [Rhipicephalus microplus]